MSQIAGELDLRVGQIDAGGEAAARGERDGVLPAAAADLQRAQALHLAQQVQLILIRAVRPPVYELSRDAMLGLVEGLKDAAFFRVRNTGAVVAHIDDGVRPFQ